MNEKISIVMNDDRVLEKMRSKFSITRSRKIYPREVRNVVQLFQIDDYLHQYHVEWVRFHSIKDGIILNEKKTKTNFDHYARILLPVN